MLAVFRSFCKTGARLKRNFNIAATELCSLSLWERVRVRGYGLSLELNPSPGSHLAMRSDLSRKGRGEGSGRGDDEAGRLQAVPFGFNSQTANSTYAFAFPRRHAPEFCTNLSPRKIRGRGERRVPAAPVASCAKVESTRVSTADTPVHPAFPHAMVLTVSFALSPVTGLVCHRRRRNEAPLRSPVGQRCLPPP